MQHRRWKVLPAVLQPVQKMLLRQQLTRRVVWGTLQYTLCSMLPSVWVTLASMLPSVWVMLASMLPGVWVMPAGMQVTL
jgi:hypothetical protein